MNAFMGAIDDLFANPDIARDAVWRPGGTGNGTSVRAIARRPDRIAEFGETRVAVPTAVFDIRVSEIPAIAEGDTLEIDGAVFAVQGEPLKDAEGLVWAVEARPT